MKPQADNDNFSMDVIRKWKKWIQDNPSHEKVPVIHIAIQTVSGWIKDSNRRKMKIV